MQFRNFFLLLLAALFIFNTNQLTAQEVKTNERGEKIVVYPDGSWRYFDESDTDIKASLKKVPNAADSESIAEPINGETALDGQKEEAILAAERALAEESLAIEMENDTRFEREELEAQLQDGLENERLSKKQIKDLETRIKIAKRREKEAISKRKAASKAAKRAENDLEELLAVDNAAARDVTNSEDIAQPENTDNNRYEERQFSEENTSVNESEMLANKSSKKKTQKKFASFDPKDDVMMNPPDPACELVFDGKDEFSGKNRKVVAKQRFFSYSPEKLRAYLKDKSYIECDAYLSSLSGGYKFLTLELTIASERAQREYGIIEKGSVLTIKLLNGENVKLFNNKTDTGTVNSLDQSVSYTAQYIISSGNEKLLRKNEVDKVRVIWSSGYEDYEVYELDFFIDQFKCLNRK